MTRSQQWDNDTAIEKMAAQFLDENLYPRFAKRYDVKRYTDTYHQFGGIDISINNTNFDEKCKIYGCLNKVLDNVGMECSLVNKAGYVSNGWFMNSQLSTDYYIFIGLSATCNRIEQLTSSSQISAADVLFVKKSDVVEYAEQYTGMQKIEDDVKELREISDKIERDEDEMFSSLPDCLGYKKMEDGKYRQPYSHGRFWLTYSSHKHEQPVNLVIPRTQLEALAHSMHFIVTKGKVKKA